MSSHDIALMAHLMRRAGFGATLEELQEASIIVHVIDITHPEREQQIDSVKSVLREMGADHVPLLEVLKPWGPVVS